MHRSVHPPICGIRAVFHMQLLCHLIKNHNDQFYINLKTFDEPPQVCCCRICFTQCLGSSLKDFCLKLKSCAAVVALSAL